MWDSLWTNATVATMQAGDAPFGLIAPGAVAASEGRIAWVGPAGDLPQGPLATTVIDCDGMLLTPGLVDPHTHVVHAGERRGDWELRLAGATRDDLVRVNGGVRGTMLTTRATRDAALFAQSSRRVAAMIGNGVTTLESKSGYGLDLETELRLLRVSRALGRRLPVSVVCTFMGAHGLPPEYDGRPDDYIDHLCTTVLPQAVAEGLVDIVDAYCDTPAFRGFTQAQTSRMFAAAAAHGKRVTLHADQYSNAGAAAVAARHTALSAAHLEYVDEPGVQAMAQSCTVAILLPGANYTLFETQKPPVDLLRKHGVPIALATNNNPSSSPCSMPTAIMNLACTLFRLTAEEAVAAFTRESARALDLLHDRGTIEPGKRADLVLWDLPHPAELPYRIAHSPVVSVVQGGETAFSATAPCINASIRRAPSQRVT
jgi:imidazolonepropionase